MVRGLLWSEVCVGCVVVVVVVACVIRESTHAQVSNSKLVDDRERQTFGTHVPWGAAKVNLKFWLHFDDDP